MRKIFIPFWAVVYVLLFAFLQITEAYHFFYIEQFQLFQFSGSYLAGLMAQAGGFGVLTGEFLVQFFTLPYAGALITAALLTLSGIIARGILRRLAPSSDAFLLYLLPPLALLMLHFDVNYLYHGTVAFLIAELFLLLYMNLKSFRVRMIAVVLMVPLLYYLAGAVATLFVAAVVLYECFLHVPRFYLVLIAPVELAVLVYIFIQTGWAETVRFACMPAAYFHHELIAPHHLFAPWLALLFIMLVAFFMRKRKEVSRKQLVIDSAVQLVVLVLLCHYLIPKYQDAPSMHLKQLDYYTRTAQWDKIISMSRGTMNDYLSICYLNMALANKGELASSMFSYDQRGVNGLMFPWDKTFIVSDLLSEEYFTIGEIAMAQKMAFEAYVTVPGFGNPRFLKRLVQTNLIFGNYAVAQKYIRILEKTFAYSDWARSQRRFLNNDRAVDADLLLGRLRRNLPSPSQLSYIEGVEPDLLTRAEQHPEEKLPIEMVGTSYLLEKNVQAFKQMIEKYAGTKVLPVLPKSFQEAVVLYYEKDPERWKQLGASDAVINRFDSYRRVILQNRAMLASLQGEIAQSFGDSYWFYYTFK